MSVATSDAPTRRTQAERREATRARLLEATLACLAEQGYARTSTTEICLRAGLSRGAQLHHFPTKADLVAAALELLFARRVSAFRDRMQALPAGPGRVRAAVDELGAVFAAPDVDAWLELVVAGRTDPEMRAHVAVLAEKLVETVQDVWLELMPPPEMPGSGTAGPGPADAPLAEVVPPFLVAVLEGVALARMTGSTRAAADTERVLEALKFLATHFGLDSDAEEMP